MSLNEFADSDVIKTWMKIGCQELNANVLKIEGSELNKPTYANLRTPASTPTYPGATDVLISDFVVNQSKNLTCTASSVTILEDGEYHIDLGFIITQVASGGLLTFEVFVNDAQTNYKVLTLLKVGEESSNSYSYFAPLLKDDVLTFKIRSASGGLTSVEDYSVTIFKV